MRLEQPFTIGDRNFDGVEVLPLYARDLVACFQKVADDRPGPSDAGVALLRARVLHQVRLLEEGKTVTPSPAEAALIPARLAVRMVAAMNDAMGKPGRIVKQGDIVTEALVYALGTPVEIAGPEGPQKIVEIELFARTFGDIDDAIAEANEFNRALTLIRRVGRPLGTKLMAVPDAAISRIMAADLLALAEVARTSFSAGDRDTL